MKRMLEEDELRCDKVVEDLGQQGSNMRKHGGDGVSWVRGAMIGKGSFGSVYLANSKKPRGCFPPIMAVKSAEVSVSGSIQKEKEALNNIGRCPYIIRCFGEEITTNENGGMMYNLLLEFGSGGTLADLIKKSGGCGLPELEVRLYARSILRGLNHIHERGYVHCDFKPENILLVNNPNGAANKFRVKIGDFGLSKRANQNKKRKLDPYCRGTPMYLSPEAVVDNIQEPPSDIWAFGCVVLEMLTGKPVWDGRQDLDADNLLKQIGEGHELPKIPSGISKEGRGFLKGCFSRKSEYRLTAEMLLNHLFVGGLVEDDAEIEEEGILSADEVGLSLMVCETDEECSYSSFSDDGSFVLEEEFFVSSWSEEEEEEVDSQAFSSFAEEGILSGQESLDATGSTTDAALSLDTTGSTTDSALGQVISVPKQVSTDSALGQVISMPEKVSTNKMPECPIAFTIPAGI